MQRRYDRYITIQVKTVTASPSGEQVIDWVVLERRRSASVLPVKGDERFAAPQEVATSQVEIKIRYSSNVADLNPGDHRIIYPAFSLDEDLEPVVRRVYDILDIAELGRGQDLKIIAERRADVVVDEVLAPLLDFSRPSNSQYLALLEDV